MPHQQFLSWLRQIHSTVRSLTIFFRPLARRSSRKNERSVHVSATNTMFDNQLQIAITRNPLRSIPCHVTFFFFEVVWVEGSHFGVLCQQNLCSHLRFCLENRFSPAEWKQLMSGRATAFSAGDGRGFQTKKQMRTKNRSWHIVNRYRMIRTTGSSASFSL